MRHLTGSGIRALALGGATTLLLALPLASAALADPLPVDAVVQPDGSVVSGGVVIGSLDGAGAFVPLPPPVDQAVEAAESAVDAAVEAAEAAPSTIAEALSQPPLVEPAPPPQPPAVPAPAAPPAAATTAVPAPVGAARQAAAIVAVPAARPAAPPAAVTPAEAAPSAGGKVAPPLRNTGGPKLQAIASLSTPFDFLSPLAAAQEVAPAPSAGASGRAESLPGTVMALGSASNLLVTTAGGLIALLLAAHVILRRGAGWS